MKNERNLVINYLFYLTNTIFISALNYYYHILTLKIYYIIINNCYN